MPETLRGSVVPGTSAGSQANKRKENRPRTESSRKDRRSAKAAHLRAPLTDVHALSTYKTLLSLTERHQQGYRRRRQRGMPLPAPTRRKDEGHGSMTLVALVIAHRPPLPKPITNKPDASRQTQASACLIRAGTVARLFSRVSGDSSFC
jgi:hypothetical protein